MVGADASRAEAPVPGTEIDGSRGLRIAWLGPIPTDGGGVSSVGRDILTGLLALGHQVDCYLAGRARPLPEELAAAGSLRVHWSGSRWQWDRWYSRDPISAFITGTACRALGMRQLGRALAADHRVQPYDVVYQFSAIEMLGFRRHLATLPPVVLQPETHAAGELRWLRRESHIARRCAPLGRRVLVRGAQAFRVLVQRRDVLKASRIICISGRFRDHLISDYGVDKSRTVVVPNPIRLDQFVPNPAPRPAGPLRIVVVGRVAVRKGVDLMVELSRRLDDLKGSVKITLIGDHSMWSDYRRLLLDLNPSVAEYLGPVAPGEIAGRLGVSDLLIQPSKYEPFALTVGEALACGVPVVVTDEVGAAEGVDGECCLAVPADADALEGAIREMVTRVAGPDRQKIRQVARREAERLFGIPHVAARVSEVLAAAAASTAPAMPQVRQTEARLPRFSARVAVMSLQAGIKRKIKPLLFSPKAAPHSIRFGPAKGVRFVLSRMHGLQQEFGVYESELNGIFRREAPWADVIYDVGASTGYTTLLMGCLGSSARLVSFEPDQASLEALRRNLQLNPSIASRVEVVPVAVGSRTSREVGERFGQAAIDDLVEGALIPPPHLVKIDVEGCELDVLTGAARTLREHRPQLIVETHSAELEQECISLLEGNGYGVRVLKHAPWRVLWPELRPTAHNRWLVATPGCTS